MRATPIHKENPIRTILASLVLLFASASAIALDTSDAGAWYDPATPGHGVLIDSRGDNVVLFWFTYAPQTPDQVWYASSAEAAGSNFTEFDLFEPVGLFPSVGFDVGDPVGTMSVEQVWDDMNQRDVLRFTFSFKGFSDRCPLVEFSPRDPTCSGGFDFVRLLNADPNG